MPPPSAKLCSFVIFFRSIGTRILEPSSSWVGAYSNNGASTKARSGRVPMAALMKGMPKASVFEGAIRTAADRVGASRPGNNRLLTCQNKIHRDR